MKEEQAGLQAKMRAIQMRNMPEARRNAAIQAGVASGKVIDLRDVHVRAMYRRQLEAWGDNLQ